MIDHTAAHNDDDGEPLDPRIAELARAYHQPPAAVPRDAMWARIEAARRGTSAAPVPVAVADPRVVSIDAARARRDAGRGRSARPWLLGAAGIAAGLLIGVSIERFRNDGDDAPVQQVASQPAATAPATPTVAPALPDESPSDAAPAAVGATAPRRAQSPSRAIVSTDSPRLAQGGGAAARANDTRSNETGTTDAASSRVLYGAMAVQTLSQAEALLVAYRAGTPDSAQARIVGRWARDVLSSTRLLLDSPAARDPELARLLGDLELLLAQLVRLSGAPLAADEREMIDRALRSRDLLPRIRSAVPSGAAATD